MAVAAGGDALVFVHDASARTPPGKVLTAEDPAEREAIVEVALLMLSSPGRCPLVER